MAGWVCRQHGQGLIEVRVSSQGRSGFAVTASGTGIGAEPGEKTLLALEYVFRASKAFGRKQRGKDAGLGGPRGMQMLAHGAGGQEFPEPR